MTYIDYRVLMAMLAVLMLSADRARAARPVVACARFLIVARRARRKPTELGDLERCALRASNAHSAHVWRDVAEAVDARYRGNTSEH